MIKKSILLFLIVLIGAITSNAWAQKTPALKNGFSIKAQLGFPSKDFGWTDEVLDDFKEDYKYGITYGLQVGNQWYFYTQESLGIGLMVNWIDVSGATKEITTDLGTLDRATLDVGLVEFGPVFTIAVDDPMAIDIYYNLRPTAMSTAYKFDDEDGEAYGGFGVTHAFGAGFRFKLLYAGVEYVTGSVKVSQDSTDEEMWKDDKMKADCFRIVAGVKF